MFFLLLLSLTLLHQTASKPPPRSSLGGFNRELYYTTDDLGVRQIALPGSIDKKTNVLLHIYINSEAVGSSIQARGFFFAESTSLGDLVGPGIDARGLSPWGHSGQPKEVQDWSYPVTFTDKDSGDVYQPEIEKAIYEEGYKNGLSFRFFPVPFTVTFNSSVSCVDVKVSNWLHMAEVCLATQDAKPPQANPVADWHRDADTWKAWAVLTPWRGGNANMFLRALVHFISYHTQIGFAGTVVYCSPALLREMLEDDEIGVQVKEGRLKLILWDRFNRFQRLDAQKVPYYEVPDQVVINNHALLTFGFQEKAALFLGDIDEFLVPRPPSSTVMDVMNNPSCVVGGGSRTPEQHAESWGSMELQRRNYRSTLTPLDVPSDRMRSSSSDQHLPYTFVAIPKLQATEIGFWTNADTNRLNCHPLVMYDMYQVSNGTFNWQPPKQLLRAKGGVHAWHVHYGILAKGKTQDVFEDKCAFVLHAVNMWSSRVRPSAFDQQGAGWRTMLPNVSRADYQLRCLSPLADPGAPTSASLMSRGTAADQLAAALSEHPRRAKRKRQIQHAKRRLHPTH